MTANNNGTGGAHCESLDSEGPWCYVDAGICSDERESLGDSGMMHDYHRSNLACTESQHRRLYQELDECPSRCRGGYLKSHDDDVYGASRNDEIYCEHVDTNACYRTGATGASTEDFYDCPEWGVLCRMSPVVCDYSDSPGALAYQWCEWGHARATCSARRSRSEMFACRSPMARSIE